MKLAGAFCNFCISMAQMSEISETNQVTAVKGDEYKIENQ